jgi:hypothetical protein
MSFWKDKAGGRSLRLTACAASALLGCIVLAMPLQSFGQSIAGSQATNLANAGSADLSGAASAASDMAPGASANSKPTKTVVPTDSDATDAPLNPRLRLDGTDTLTTGSILDDDIRRVNTRDPSVDNVNLKQRTDRNDPQGIQLGSFTLRPSVNESFNFESNRTGGTNDERTYLQTDLRSTLTSDWSRHQLTITGDGLWQRNLSGTGQEQPNIDINADLRLDLPSETTAHITTGYQFYREDTDDPNAISGAAKQSGVNQFDGGLALEHDFGILRGTTALALTRTIYSDATLSDGTQVTLSDRDQTAGILRGRIGYELSPALIPFVEADLGRTVYDDKFDSSGYQRSGQSYGGRAGVEFDFGEKLKGELGIGYEQVNFDDARLASIDTPTLDGNIAWSPQRGTDVNIGFSTSVQPSTTAGDSGYVAYQLTETITHQMTDNLVAKLTGGTIWRDYPSNSTFDDETVYDAAAGLTWGVNRYLDLTGNVGYELTSRTGDDTRQLRAGIGLTAKR